MNGYMKRDDDFEKRRAHLTTLSDEALKERFWALAEALADPLLELARTHTSPAVERSVLLRMGFSSLEAQPLVDKAIEQGLIAHGVGHVVYYTAKSQNIDIRKAGLELLEGNYWKEAQAHFNVASEAKETGRGGKSPEFREGAYHANAK